MTKRATKNTKTASVMSQDEARAKLRELFRLDTPEGKYHNQTAAELMADAARSYQAAEDSFQRSDTDGFLSQWASNLTGSCTARKAEAARHNGKAVFGVVIDIATGVVVASRTYEGQYGTSWIVEKEHQARLGRAFLPMGGNSRVHKALGVEERMAWADAYVHITGSGTGLSGTAFVATRMDKDATIETTPYNRQAIFDLIKAAFPESDVECYGFGYFADVVDREFAALGAK